MCASRLRPAPALTRQIDLDTIDYSNLNRQFLFQRSHVGKSKAVVARESALRYNPRARIEAHHASVMDAAFGPQYVAQFALVMNALDNLAARRHVNRICLAAGVRCVYVLPAGNAAGSACGVGKRRLPRTSASARA